MWLQKSTNMVVKSIRKFTRIITLCKTTIKMMMKKRQKVAVAVSRDLINQKKDLK